MLYKGNDRIGLINENKDGTIMQIIDYKNANNVIVEFQDEYKAKKKTRYDRFVKGNVDNPYGKYTYGIGIIGDKYPTYINGVDTKEYGAWKNIIQRSYSDKWKKTWPTYKDVTCSNEWLLFENFYEWIISEDNYEKWLNGYRWCVDKDILVKNNKLYSKGTCCLVSPRINSLFTKANKLRGDLPIGVQYFKRDNCYRAECDDDNKHVFLGYYNNPEDAFYAYKRYKENIIKRVAKEEYLLGNITKQCYEAMMIYEVDITD